MLTTILGSCVSACLRDPVVGVGGMNHFLLPGDNGNSGHTGRGASALRYGVHAMELLVNGLLQRGAQRSRLEAKLFGGARMMKGLTDVGELNASFAERFLQDEGIALVGGSLRGAQGRRIQFWPVSGRARQIMLSVNNEGLFHKETQATPLPDSGSGEVDLF
jgi:chemotaxis protein CheD